MVSFQLSILLSSLPFRSPLYIHHLTFSSPNPLTTKPDTHPHVKHLSTPSLSCTTALPPFHLQSNVYFHPHLPSPRVYLIMHPSHSHLIFIITVFSLLLSRIQGQPFGNLLVVAAENYVLCSRNQTSSCDVNRTGRGVVCSWMSTQRTRIPGPGAGPQGETPKLRPDREIYSFI